MGAGGTGRKGSGAPGLWAGTSPLLLYQGLRGGVLWWIPERDSHRGCLCEPGWLVLFVLFPLLFSKPGPFGQCQPICDNCARRPGLGLSDPGTLVKVWGRNLSECRSSEMGLTVGSRPAPRMAPPKLSRPWLQAKAQAGQSITASGVFSRAQC